MSEISTADEKRLLLFGANGQVGREIVAAARAGGLELTAIDRSACDLATPGRARALILSEKPGCIINAAAYTAVDSAESEPALASRINAEAVGEIAGAAKETGAELIHLSTDYVFSGDGDAPLSEDAPAGPLNVYGETKLDGENLALSAHDGAVILRTSWVFSEHGANFVKTMLRLGAERTELSIVADQFGGPTSAASIADAVLKIAMRDVSATNAAGVFHFQGAPSTSWAGFATEIFAVADMKIDIRGIETKDYPTPAARPRYTVLDCAKIRETFGVTQPDWRKDLAIVVNSLQSAANEKRD